MKLYIRRNKQVAAWMKLTNLHHNGHIEIEYLFVNKEFRGQGLATKLVKRAQKKAEGTTLVGLIDPHPDSSLTYEQEKNWLIGLGFKEEKKYSFGDCYKRVMIYESKKTLKDCKSLDDVEDNDLTADLFSSKQFQDNFKKAINKK